MTAAADTRHTELCRFFCLPARPAVSATFFPTVYGLSPNTCYNPGVDFVELPRCSAVFKSAVGGDKTKMNSLPLQPLVALVAGVLILIKPRLLNYVVAIYLILVGVLGLARYY